MASKQDQPCYMDGVPVKISEKYKPPRKINLAISYPQKLVLNRIVQDTPSYDFTLETNVLQKMNEWKSMRQAMADERLNKLERLKKDTLQNAEELSQKVDDNDLNTAVSSASDKSLSNESNKYIVKQDILYPTPHNNILTPILLNSTDAVAHKIDAADRSPFNISDFEADNSSPFDNMELKTINDMAELAQVLQNEDSTNKSTNQFPTTSNCFSQYGTTTYSTAYTTDSCTENNQRCLNYYDGPQQISYLQPNTSANDQYYNYLINGRPNTHNNVPAEYNNADVLLSQNMKVQPKTSFRSVPDIVTALQNELDDTHIDAITTRASKQTDSEQSDSCYYNLPVSLQQLSTKICSMGFPLPRVAKVVQLIGDDQKKVVDHLLAMSELLDLGFTEDEVSKALLKCGNDRDKAIDTLIS